MFAMYTGFELFQAMHRLGDNHGSEVTSMVRFFMHELEEVFYRAPYTIEVIGPTEINGTVLESHLTPGHTLESLWFYIHTKEGIEGRPLNPDELEKVCSMGKWALEKGWDEKEGGLLRFIHRDGGKPRGVHLEDPYEACIRQTWDTKLWWVHSEALYFTALMAQRTNDPYWLKSHRNLFDYTFTVFPNPNTTVGEWIQIRRRDGSPLEKVVALPVKDPYHIVRNLLLYMELHSG